MIKKVLQYIFLGLAVYAGIVYLVINFYKDDPRAMLWKDREAFNKRFISKLKPDTQMNLETVLDNLGSPDLTYVKSDEDTVFQIVYYRTQLMKPDGITTQDECTGLLFKNGQLILWGAGAIVAYEKALKNDK
ncbi:DUF3192 domain-containing protein [Pseudoalteromonas luteoviolacea]|uniref:DUF3192 domain-containing protein n=1 Tax=Pseudoalteromonas luteoviolacea S4054 TaxID=1129367 RepID=A0A0F6ACX6_9GAMM|nr:DUF3192 domain-containing protein [Pseudoalteromonas luteoviolacea]AOT10581.1 hypothetical protein S4054249_22220 [Pseudoalteromonas luteoviolacea]AOT15351.1 hypothetical protein S40542_21375 [Pseudoalteromonas luteoviolacea]AOT20400.1 hypothetical protein S4054_22135 [Pseudoalteromonas luteoviolacea]KKE83676.1 hypothetical protein N479_12685 [Pseudoalteromonas luteoviolacea S4054]KZN71879.1 hypothetical protein N481_17045 [Pseudoalteromonas luteoviolacea S4047-1]